MTRRKSDPPPSPVHMTRRRATALLVTAEIGAEILRLRIKDQIARDMSAESMALARDMDSTRVEALDAMTLIRKRYLTESAVPYADDTPLFTDDLTTEETS